MTISRGEFAAEVLIGIGAEPTPQNIEAMLAWMQGENTLAANNPLATTLSTYDTQGATHFNTFGDQGQYHVRNFTTPEQGIDATIDTLKQSYYSNIVNALQRGTNVNELESLVKQSPWGTGDFGAVTGGSYNTPLGTQSFESGESSMVYPTRQAYFTDGQFGMTDSLTSYSSSTSTPTGQVYFTDGQFGIVQTEQDALTTLSPEDRNSLAMLSPEELEALKQFNATATEEQKAMLRRMAEGYAPAVDETLLPIETPALQPDNSLELQRQDDAWAVARGMLDDMDLGSLYGKVRDWIVSGRSAETAIALIRFEPEFKARFRGMDERLANGYNSISPARYLELEDNYRNMLEQAGFPVDFIEDFHEFIANDVNETEFGDRISVAMRAAESADPVILEELKTRYGIGIDTKSDITMYFLNPERAVTLLEARTQLGVAELSAATTKAIGGRLEERTGRELFQSGYVSREVSERLKGQGSLRQRMVGEGATNARTGPLSSTALAAAEFGLDSDAVARLKMLRARRSQRGVLKSGAAITASGVSGFSVAS